MGYEFERGESNRREEGGRMLMGMGQVGFSSGMSMAYEGIISQVSYSLQYVRRERD